jgi:DNA polymerase-3 subunit delta
MVMAAVRILEPDALLAELKDGEVLPVYLLAGPDGFRAERTARWLRDRDLDPASADFNSQTLHADEASPAAIAEAAAAYPMFGALRFVWVRRAEALPTGAALEPLLAYLGNPSPRTRLILTASKLDKRLKLTAACADAGRVVSFNTLTGAPLAAQVRRQAKEHGLRLTAEAIETLLDLLGEDLGEIDMELAKLALADLEGDSSLGPDEIREQVARSRDVNAFALADRLEPRHAVEALHLWLEMRQRGGDPFGAGAILAWRLRQLLQLKAGLDTGAPPAQASSQAGLSPWQARRVLPLAQANPRPLLEQALAAWRDADRRAKSTSLGADLAYDLALLQWAATALP